MGRFGSAKTEAVIVDRDDAGLSRPDHPDVATGTYAHLVQPHHEIGLPINLNNRGRHAGCEQSEGNHVP
jgi:hypothetical protein